MKVTSTRGSELITFEESLFTSYCRDGGMTMPERIPQIDLATLERWKSLSYVGIVKEIVSLFVDEVEISKAEQHALIEAAFSKFDIDEVVRVARLKDGLNVLELWHGETMAFKDLAMTCTAHFLKHFLRKRGRKMTIVIITSGDTGSSALYSLRDIEEVSTVVLYPHNMISELQKLMMTTIDDPTAYVFAVDCELEDMETYFTRLTDDHHFVERHSIGTLNSLNWCRIMIQSAHHVYGYLQVATSCGSPVNTIIPNGACGNLSACVLAQRMGIPLRPTCVTNANDTLDRILRHNDWGKREGVATLAPAMNMTFLVNFERILWLLRDDGDDETIGKVMASYYDRDDHTTRLPDDFHRKVAQEITTSVASDESIKRAIARCRSDNSYLVDPHTACALAYFYRLTPRSAEFDKSLPSICVSTAAPEKFPEILRLAADEDGFVAPSSDKIDKIKNKTQNFKILRDGWEENITEKIEEITRKREEES